MVYPQKSYSAEITIKKSRFVGLLVPVDDEMQAKLVVSTIQKEHKKARHVCYAIIFGNNGEYNKKNDNGEPTGTAGMPILEVMKRQNISNAILVVVRYFGGILLGTGGLNRAYRECAMKTVEQLVRE